MKSTATLQRRAPMSRGTAQLARTAGFKPSISKPLPGIKKKACRVCRIKFAPTSPLAVVCGIPCAIEHGKRVTALQKAKAQRQERAADKVKREAMKGYHELVKEAQTAFNAYVRLRDDGMPCICCGRHSNKDFLTGSEWDAGHYRSTGAAPHLRFNEDNVHRQLVFCNRNRSGNAVEYRIGLIRRIGLARVEALEANNTAAKWTHDELRAIKAEYQRRVREMKKAAA